jgi:hypothetical protein
MPPPPALGLIPGGFKHGPSELCQLALVAWELTRIPVTLDWVAEEKHDGIRLLWIGGQMVTREGEPFEAAEFMRPEFERLERRAGKPMFFDCEFFVYGGFLATLAAFKRGADNLNGMAYLFDGFPLDHWHAGGSKLCLADRRRILETIFDEWTPARVHLVTQRPCETVPGFVQMLAEGVWARGGEGLMLNDTRAPYERGRTASWLKVKRSLELKARVLEVLKDGAALRIEIEGRKLKVAVPPPQRFAMGKWLVGQEVTVTAMEWTPKGSLRQGMLDTYPCPPVQTGGAGAG